MRFSILHLEKLMCLILVTTFISMFVACTSDADVANEVVALIDTSKIPSQSEFDNILAHYNELTSEQKEIANVDDYIEKYRDVDLNAILKLEEEISKLSSDSKYSSVKPLLEEYDSLSDREKALISDSDVLDEFCQLTEWDKAGISAIKFLRQTLKDANSLELKSAKAIKKGSYYVVLNYNATNGFGGSINKTMCIDITADYRTGLIGLSLLHGKYDESSNANYKLYRQYDDDEITLDPDKLMDNLETDF